MFAALVAAAPLLQNFKERIAKQEEWAQDVLAQNKHLTEENCILRQQMERSTKLTEDLKATVDTSQTFIKALQEKIDNQVCAGLVVTRLPCRQASPLAAMIAVTESVEYKDRWRRCLAEH